ncbi:hypothetical protein OOJ91_34210 [Micromonospora lupini]|uniref:hypothetical protein n=1 Tax=Micromonospora lupini TaxID=285679 RepID=UPI002253BC19|nr:hypothetical protein [Micromonospora lupini]MCX5070904.1 hypothetical protein [Micromonospora lupini]
MTKTEPTTLADPVQVRITATAADGTGAQLEVAGTVLEFPRDEWNAWTKDERDNACAEAAWEAANRRTQVEWEPLNASLTDPTVGPPPPPEPERVTVRWTVSENHEATVPFAELFDYLVEKERIPHAAPRTLATLTECDLEGWAADQEDNSTYDSTGEREIDEVVEAG